MEDWIHPASRNERRLGAPVTGLHPWRDGFVTSTGDGKLTVIKRSLKAARRIAVSQGAILETAVDPLERFLVCASDDGRVTKITPPITPVDIWQSSGRWISDILVAPFDAIAWAIGKTVYVQTSDASHALAHDHGAQALAFAPESKRMAVAHSGGVSIWNLEAEEPGRRILEWPGAHIALTWSPDEKFIVTAMWDGTLHAWQMKDGTPLAMGRYPSKPRQMSWSHDGEWLATSGYYQAILWSFAGSGPLDKSAERRAFRMALVTAVAFHPNSDALAVGYQDGAIVLAHQCDDQERLVRPATHTPISHLCWSRDGKRLAYGTTDGVIGLAEC